MVHLSQVGSHLMLECILLCIEDTLPFNWKEGSENVMYSKCLFCMLKNSFTIQLD